MFKIPHQVIIDVNLLAEKCTDDYGGVNKWYFKVKTEKGYWELVQWMDVSRIQMFFKTKLPRYKEVEQEVTYELAD